VPRDSLGCVLICHFLFSPLHLLSHHILFAMALRGAGSGRGKGLARQDDEGEGAESAATSAVGEGTSYPTNTEVGEGIGSPISNHLAQREWRPGLWRRGGARPSHRTTYCSAGSPSGSLRSRALTHVSRSGSGSVLSSDPFPSSPTTKIVISLARFKERLGHCGPRSFYTFS